MHSRRLETRKTACPCLPSRNDPRPAHPLARPCGWQSDTRERMPAVIISTQWHWRPVLLSGGGRLTETQEPRSGNYGVQDPPAQRAQQRKRPGEKRRDRFRLSRYAGPDWLAVGTPPPVSVGKSLQRSGRDAAVAGTKARKLGRIGTGRCIDAVAGRAER